MKTLTKEQVQKLTPDQQVAIATIEAEHVRARQELIDRSWSSSRKRDIVVGCLMGTALALAMYGLLQPKAFAFSIIVLVGLVNVQISGLNHRLSALLELLNPDLVGLSETEQHESQQTPPPKGGPVGLSGTSGVGGAAPSVS